MTDVRNHNRYAEAQLSRLHTDEGYRQHFMDAVFWQPYIEQVCQQQDLTDIPQVTIGLPGSFPTFGVDQRWIIKFFGRNFEGDTSFQAEREVNTLVGQEHQILVPALIGAGELYPQAVDWPWPYLIFEFVSGVSIGEVYEQVSFSDKLAMAQMMGDLTSKLHRLASMSDMSLTLRNSYYNLIRDQYWRCTMNHQLSGILPPHLTAQIESYLLPRDALLAPDALGSLIHADLTIDHLLGQIKEGRWHSQYLIDFGDAMVGDFHYELIALHLSLFDCDKRLLRTYLDAYGLDAQTRQALPKRAMSLTLLHRFDVLDMLPRRAPQALQVETLDDLARLLWDVDEPGIVLTNVE